MIINVVYQLERGQVYLFRLFHLVPFKADFIQVLFRGKVIYCVVMGLGNAGYFSFKRMGKLMNLILCDVV